MPFDYSVLPVRYRFGHADTDEVQVRYSYEERVASTSTADVVYRWNIDTDSNRWQRQYGFWANSTQELGNIFPHWHMARHNPGGDTQLFLNAWGMGLDDVKQNYFAYRKDLFIGTADLSQPDVFYYAPVQNVRGATRLRNTNLLLNSSFSIRGLARVGMPVHWCKRAGTTTAEVELVDRPVMVGSYSLKVTAADGEKAFISQRVTDPIPRDQYITGSIWYMVPMDFETLESDENTAAITLSIVYADGSMEVSRSPLRLGTNGIFSRASVTVQANKTVSSIQYSINVWNESGQTITVYLGAAQLSLTDHPTPWIESQLTKIPYLRDNVIPEPGFDVFLDLGTEEVTEGVTYNAWSARRMTYVPSFHDLWYGVTPSRAAATEVEVVPAATNRNLLGWLALTNGDRIVTSWRIADNKIEVYNRSITHEIFGAFDIAEFWLDERDTDLAGVISEDEDPTFARTLETLCVVNDLLYVICLEQYQGTTRRVLKVVNPRSLTVNPNAYSANLDMHLECIGDVDLGINTGTADYLGTIDSDPSALLLRISSTYYRLDFEHDYYTYDERRGQVILRNLPTGATVITI